MLTDKVFEVKVCVQWCVGSLDEPEITESGIVLENGETMLLDFSCVASIFGGNEYDRKVDTLYLFMTNT